MLVDLIIFAGVNAAFMKAPKGYSAMNIGLLVVIGIGYLLRLLMQLFLQVQWFLSTLEHRNWFRQQPTVFLSTMKFIISSLNANFCSGLITCLASCIAAPCLFIAYYGVRYSPDDSFPVNYMIVLLFGGLGLVMLSISLYSLFKISRDLVRRGFWVFGKNGWAGQRRIRDREDEFVLS